MHFTRPRELVIAGLIGLVLGRLLFQLAYGTFPPLPLFVGATLFLLGLVESVLAFSVRARIRDGKVRAAMAIARMVALAKASSLAGAFMLGAWIGVFSYLAPRRTEVTAAANDFRSAAVGLVSAAVLIGAALWLEHCCRTPEPRDPDRRSGLTG